MEGVFWRVLFSFPYYFIECWAISLRAHVGEKIKNYSSYYFFRNGRRVVLFGAEKLDEKFRLDKTDSISEKRIFYERAWFSWKYSIRLFYKIVKISEKRENCRFYLRYKTVWLIFLRAHFEKKNEKIYILLERFYFFGAEKLNEKFRLDRTSLRCQRSTDWTILDKSELFFRSEIPNSPSKNLIVFFGYWK